MQIVMVEPGKAAYPMELGHSLKAMQQAVGGAIQILYPLEEPVALVCHEEGKLLGLPPNRGPVGRGGAALRHCVRSLLPLRCPAPKRPPGGADRGTGQGAAGAVWTARALCAGGRGDPLPAHGGVR